MIRFSRGFYEFFFFFGGISVFFRVCGCFLDLLSLSFGLSVVSPKHIQYQEISALFVGAICFVFPLRGHII